MAERNGHKTLDAVAKELGITEDEARTLIRLLNIQSITFPEDRRVRFYSPGDIARLKEVINKG